ncbi:uncharacterized protein MYCGRDRAFT_94454 [Zymoseptoria tritici IPO323]|uniref:Uncharacterized protein n=1 Tax=Zymoseptoria tritici (strain CBS 115943 / IPO323) TaxID=336722 RepID=F9XFR1_ZYMTI|nr:uncharacterized protein MYCGRDRAFT_94454 [Zymoseptoria tritici IPO323]EGP86141.1 hypothetical protein MYCGRDRAFT_94454 [Zymoseptoria tritici IPO323]
MAPPKSNFLQKVRKQQKERRNLAGVRPESAFAALTAKNREVARRGNAAGGMAPLPVTADNNMAPVIPNLAIPTRAFNVLTCQHPNRIVTETENEDEGDGTAPPTYQDNTVSVDSVVDRVPPSAPSIITSTVAREGHPAGIRYDSAQPASPQPITHPAAKGPVEPTTRLVIARVPVVVLLRFKNLLTDEIVKHGVHFKLLEVQIEPGLETKRQVDARFDSVEDAATVKAALDGEMVDFIKLATEFVEGDAKDDCVDD